MGVLGYDLNQLSTHNDLENDKNLKWYLKKHRMPDVIVVKKHYPYYSKTTKRKWKLKSMAKEKEYNVDKYQAEKEQIDNELFMREIEQDFDLRCRINVYKDHNYKANNNHDHHQIPQIPENEKNKEDQDMINID